MNPPGPVAASYLANPPAAGEPMNFNIDVTGIVVVSVIFITAAVIVATVFYFVHRADELKHQTIRMALEKGQPLPPELLHDGPRRREPDLNRGIKLCFIGAGLSLFFHFLNPPGAEHLWAIGLIVLFVGLGHLASHFVTRSSRSAAPPME
jgi:hypothetical protein